MPRRKKHQAESSPPKLLFWTAVAGLFFVLIGAGVLMEDMMRGMRNKMHETKASGDIVFVKIDDQSLRAVGRWPWPRRVHAQLVDRLSAAGAKHIHFDILFENASEAADDQRLANAAKRAGNVTFPVRTSDLPDGSGRDDLMLLRELLATGDLTTVSVDYNYQNAAWKLPYAHQLADAVLPGLSVKLAGLNPESARVYPVDYSIDPQSIPTVSASAVLNGSAGQDKLAGKDVVIAAASGVLGDEYFIPGHGKMPGAYVQILGAETLKRGTPWDLGWIPAFLIALTAAAAALYVKRPSHRPAILGAAGVTLLICPVFLEARLIFVDVVPGLFVLATVGCVLARRLFRERGLVNSLSGLPNLNALRADSQRKDRILIAAKVINYAEIAAALPAEREHQLVEQIVSRLSVGSGHRTFYQGDGGIFAWFEESRAGVPHHVEALSSLFRNPLKIDGLAIDPVVTFGVDIGSSRSVSNRLGSALVAAEEAAHEGLKWKYYDPEVLQDASWRLSILSQLDAAIDDGQVWVAYQPKVDLATRKLVGAEALARWTHPEKGPIAASEFVAAAEQHDRIAKLTMFMLDKAIAAAAGVNRRGLQFDIAVNLSGRLLCDRSLITTVAALLEQHGLEAKRLTLELTETAALAGTGESFEMLAALRELGVQISIDDYGTGLSTLDYLKKIPAAEIKIDQSFVKGMCDNRSDRLMVQSTIALAHSLGRKVVAEGVEQAAVLDLLAEMRCDFAQGFITGRPASLESLIKRLSAEQRREVA